jgi:hypothetical protein
MQMREKQRKVGDGGGWGVQYWDLSVGGAPPTRELG